MHTVLFSGSGDDLHVKFLSSSEDLIKYQENATGTLLSKIDGLDENQQRLLLKGLGLFFPQFNTDNQFSKILLPHWLGKGAKQFEVDTIGFFPGSFNPWHEGHMECVQSSNIESIIILPDYSPWKDNEKKDQPWEDFKALGEKLKDTPYLLYPGFWGEQEKNPTSGWLPSTHVINRILLMGADTFMDLEKWKQPEILLRSLYSIIVLGRKIDKDKLENQKENILKFNSKLNIQLNFENPYENISSTDIRKK
ncbi:MAG: hypothetical protein KC493_08130 [Bacteriovoracaceae bacterium]|nr:hypothetical protein [Bacteriovoracaceae bacterium]